MLDFWLKRHRDQGATNVIKQHLAFNGAGAGKGTSDHVKTLEPPAATSDHTLTQQELPLAPDSYSCISMLRVTVAMVGCFDHLLRALQYIRIIAYNKIDNGSAAISVLTIQELAAFLVPPVKKFPRFRKDTKNKPGDYECLHNSRSEGVED